MDKTLIIYTILSLMLFMMHPLVGQDDDDYKNQIIDSLHCINMPVRQVLKEIAKRVDVQFVYDDALVKNKTITIDSRNISLKDVLAQITDQVGIRFKFFKPSTIILHKQKGRYIQGVVRDAVTNQPLANANIYFKNTYYGTITDEFGIFKIFVVFPYNELIISYMGYESKHFNANNLSNTVDVRLIPTVLTFDALSVYGRSYFEVKNNLNRIQPEQLLGINTISSDVHNKSFSIPEITIIPEKGVKPSYVQLKTSTNIGISPRIKNRFRKRVTEENLTIVNGIRLNEAFHIKIIPGTNAEVFSRSMINDINYSCGGFSATHGDVLNSLLLINYKCGNKSSIGGKASSNFMETGIFLEGPISSGISAMFHARKSHLSPLLDLAPEKHNTEPSFYDIQGQLDYEISPQHQIKINFLKSNDDFKFSPKSQNYSQIYDWDVNYLTIRGTNIVEEIHSEEIKYSTQFFAVQSVHSMIDNMTLKTSLIYTDEQNFTHSVFNQQTKTTFPFDEDFISELKKRQNYYYDLGTQNVQVRFCFDRKVSSFNIRQFGFSYQHTRYRVDEQWKQPIFWKTNLFEEYDLYTNTFSYPLREFHQKGEDYTRMDIRGFRLGGYFIESNKILDRFFYNAGIRLDYYSLNQRVAIDPRFHLSYKLSETSLLRLAVGQYTKFPYFKQIYENKNFPENPKAQHVVLSYEGKTSQNLTLKLEGYYKQFKHLIPVLRLGDGSIVCNDFNTSTQGFSQGFQVSMLVTLPSIQVWGSYDYAVTQEQMIKNSSYHARYNDQRHTLSCAIDLHLGRNWNLTVTNYYGSGYAFTPNVLVEDLQTQAFQWIVDDNNSSYFPSYNRLDIKINKSFKIGNGSLDAFLLVINALNKRNVFAYNYYYSQDGIPLQEGKTLFSLLPIAGLSYSF